MAIGRGILAPFLLASHALIWISSVIVLGITAWFINVIGNSGGRHLTYLIVVAALSTLLYPIALGLSRSNARRHLLPKNLIFSYLWLAAFVVATDDWADDSCVAGPGPFGRCAYKHTIMAFSFLPFFFSAMNVLFEGYLARDPDNYVGEKHHAAATEPAAGTRGTAAV